jgi:hypothetical protein
MKGLKFIAVIVVVIIALQNNAFGQVSFSKTYGGAKSDWTFSAQQTSDGGFIMAGGSTSFGAGNDDFLLIKTDASGNVQWAKTYGGAESEWAYSAQQTRDGGFIMAGYTTSFGATSDFILIKTDTNGNIQWAKTYGGIDYDYATFVRQTSNGGYIVSGSTLSFGAGEGDVLVLKLDSNGNIQWAKTYGGPDVDWPSSVQQTSDGGFIVAGETISFGAGGRDFLLIKIDASGVIQWVKTFGGTGDDRAWSIQQISDGGFIVAGGTQSFGAGGLDFLFIKIDSNGIIQWAKTYGGIGHDFATSVQQTSDGGFIIGGNILLIKTYADGNIQWAKTYGGVGSAWSFQQANDGGFIIVGNTYSFGAGDQDILFIKTDKNGNLGSCSIVGSPTPTVTSPSPTVTTPSPSTFSPTISVANASITVTSPTISVSDVCPLTSTPSESSVPLQFKLLQNYPNPFNSTTTIPFLLPQRTNVTLKVYDVFGREIATLINKEFDAGEHSIQFNANDLPTGVYFYRLQAGNFIEQKKMILIK